MIKQAHTLKRKREVETEEDKGFALGHLVSTMNKSIWIQAGIAHTGQ
jgi:hypothetical protein